ncbi:hypothetical protein MPER_11086 [Moniliophthora perniciosa FA553]|nr:hypothetical protein MPER_11086 [Moniliophthora perniciosa FA553]
MNVGRRKGHRYKLTEIIELIHQDTDLQYAINHPKSTQAKELLEELEAYQMDQFKGTIANPKAIHNDVTKTFQKMSETQELVISTSELSLQLDFFDFGFCLSLRTIVQHFDL